MTRRVAIVGAGTINPLGPNLPTTLEAMAEGRCAIGPLTLRDVERLTIRVGAQVTDYDEAGRWSPREVALYDRATQFALIVAAETVAVSVLSFEGEAGLRAGVILGTAAGGLSTWEQSYRAVFEEGRSRVPPLTVPRLMTSAAASHVSMVHGLRGPVLTVASACASSNHAIGLAFQMIRAGMADAMLAGGSEAMLIFGGVKAGRGCGCFPPTPAGPSLPRATAWSWGRGLRCWRWRSGSGPRRGGLPSWPKSRASP